MYNPEDRTQELVFVNGEVHEKENIYPVVSIDDPGAPTKSTKSLEIAKKEVPFLEHQTPCISKGI